MLGTTWGGEKQTRTKNRQWYFGPVLHPLRALQSFTRTEVLWLPVPSCSSKFLQLYYSSPPWDGETETRGGDTKDDAAPTVGCWGGWQSPGRALGPPHPAQLTSAFAPDGAWVELGQVPWGCCGGVRFAGFIPALSVGLRRFRESEEMRQPRWISIRGSPLCCCKRLQNIWYVRITRFSVRSQQILSISGWDTFRASLNSLIAEFPSWSVAWKHMVHPPPGVVVGFLCCRFFFLFCFLCVWLGFFVWIFCCGLFLFSFVFFLEQDRRKILDTTSNYWWCGLLGMTLFYLC